MMRLGYIGWDWNEGGIEFFREKNYAFIKCWGSKKDLFVHISAMSRNVVKLCRTCEDVQKVLVAFKEVKEENKKPRAENVRLLYDVPDNELNELIEEHFNSDTINFSFEGKCIFARALVSDSRGYSYWKQKWQSLPSYIIYFVDGKNYSRSDDEYFAGFCDDPDFRAAAEKCALGDPGKARALLLIKYGFMTDEDKIEKYLSSFTSSEYTDSQLLEYMLEKEKLPPMAVLRRSFRDIALIDKLIQKLSAEPGACGIAYELTSAAPLYFIIGAAGNIEGYELTDDRIIDRFDKLEGMPVEWMRQWKPEALNFIVKKVLSDIPRYSRGLVIAAIIALGPEGLLEYPDYLRNLIESGDRERTRLLPVITLEYLSKLYEADLGLFDLLINDTGMFSMDDKAKCLYRSGLMFDLVCWKVLSDREKIRTLKYAALELRERKDELKDKLIALGRYEKAAGNKLLRALLRFMFGVYAANENELADIYFGRRGADADDSAHSSLMQYVIEHFYTNACDDIPDALYELLPKNCRKDSYPFCDARSWITKAAGDKPARNTVWCPRNERKGTICDKVRGSAPEEFMLKADCTEPSEMHLNELLHCIGEVSGASMKQRLGIGFVPDYQYRIGACINTALSLRKTLICRRCGKPLVPLIDYSKKINARMPITRFGCAGASDKWKDGSHDTGVYINFCFHCNTLVDSRKCTVQDAEQYYLCKCCGGGSAATPPGTICPNCGRPYPSGTEYISNYYSISKTCPACGYSVDLMN